MNMFSILFLLILATNDCGGQKIELTIPSHSALCEKGFRADLDPYNITGTAGPNIITFLSSGWNPVIDIQLQPVGATQFDFLCVVRTGKDGSLCTSTATGSCFCDYIDATTGSAHFVVNLTAMIGHNQGTVRAEWQNGPIFLHSSNNITLQSIYDVNAADLTLTVNGLKADDSSESCGASFKDNVKNTIKLCCSKAAEPCYPRLAFNRTVVAENQSLCVEYTFTANETVNVTKSYSVCTLNDYKQRGFCVIETKPPDKNNLGLILGLVLGLGLPLIGVAIGFICWKYGKIKCGAINSKDNTNNSPTESTGGNNTYNMTPKDGANVVPNSNSQKQDVSSTDPVSTDGDNPSQQAKRSTGDYINIPAKDGTNEVPNSNSQNQDPVSTNGDNRRKQAKREQPPVRKENME